MTCGLQPVQFAQVRSIIGQIRPDRQTLLFSATMPTKVERLVRDALTSPVRITVGEVGAANEDITQARLLCICSQLKSSVASGSQQDLSKLLANAGKLASGRLQNSFTSA